MKTNKEIAIEWGISDHAVNDLCRRGEIPGAIKEGKSWRIPDDAVKPADGRVSSGNYMKRKKAPVRKALPIGISDYVRAQEEYYYVDKTMLIKDFLDRKPLVSLFTRPRRFGKTLNMDMLRVFFEISDEDTSRYFVDKKIWKCGEAYRKYQGKYPVIFLTFKDVKFDTWAATVRKIQRLLQDEYGRHQEILTDYYTSKTQLVALEFAKKLAARIYIDFGKMDEDISAFGQKINDAIDETERLVTAQRKVNKGLEDMRGAIIEVSEDDAMIGFETELKIDKIDMPNVARQLRESILPESDFINFGRLSNDISIDGIKDAFDMKLSQIVKTKHDEKAESDKKVLGLNILTQLQQKLRTDDDIKAFAIKIVNQSGVYLKLNNDQMQLHLRNNENDKSPTNPASINKKTILVSIPSPDDNEGLKRFADKLERAFLESFNQSTARTTIVVNKKSPRKDELSIITVAWPPAPNKTIFFILNSSH